MMIKFQEIEENKEKYQGLFFKEVKLVLHHKSPPSSSLSTHVEDWFDHETYLKEKMPILRSIRPPTLILLKSNTYIN